MQFIFVSAFSSSNHGGNVHTAVFGFYLKYICLHTCTHPNHEFVLEKTKAKECACCFQWTKMKAPLALGAWRECSKVLAHPHETVSLTWKCMTAASSIVVIHLQMSNSILKKYISNFACFHIPALYEADTMWVLPVKVGTALTVQCSDCHSSSLACLWLGSVLGHSSQFWSFWLCKPARTDHYLPPPTN